MISFSRYEDYESNFYKEKEILTLYGINLFNKVTEDKSKTNTVVFSIIKRKDLNSAYTYYISSGSSSILISIDDIHNIVKKINKGNNCTLVNGLSTVCIINDINIIEPVICNKYNGSTYKLKNLRAVSTITHALEHFID